MEIKIIPCKPYVKLTYEPCVSIDEIVGKFAEKANAKEQPEFLESLQFSYNKGILTHGEMVDEPANDGYVNRIGLWHKPW